MAKVAIVYESKYGNTRLVAETIAAGIREVPEVEAVSYELQEIQPRQITDYNAVIIGSPNHIGGATRGIRNFIDNMGELNLSGKLVAVFDTYLSQDFEKAVKKMERQISKRLPGLVIAAPGLSIKVGGMKGPISDGELPKCRDFGTKIAGAVKGRA